MFVVGLWTHLSKQRTNVLDLPDNLADRHGPIKCQSIPSKTARQRSRQIGETMGDYRSDGSADLLS
jgi:hypothetical protein